MAKQRRTRAFVVVGAMLLASVLPGCSRSTHDWDKHGGSPRIVVTIPALDNFVRNVGGDRVAVVCLCTTQGPHHYTESAEDAILLRDADLFFAVGLTLDDKFADPIQMHSHNPHLKYVKLGDAIKLGESQRKTKLLRPNEEHEEGKEEEHEHEHDHHHGAYDPHIWLGIDQAIAMVEIIRDELKKTDPNNEAEYDKNAEKYIKTLKDLHAYGKSKLKDKQNRKLIAFHESLGYFAQSFDLKIVAAIEVTPGSEAAGPHIAHLVELCKKDKVRVIAVEPQYPKETSAEVLRKQVKDIQFAVVDPLETVENKKDLKDDEKELKNPNWYEKKMKRNLDNLAKALP